MGCSDNLSERWNRTGMPKTRPCALPRTPRGNHDPYRYREGFPPPRLPSITLDYPPVCTRKRGKQWGMVLQVVGRPSGSCGMVGRPRLAAGGTLVPRRVGASGAAWEVAAKWLFLGAMEGSVRTECVHVHS
eukprot:791680-Prymnesium_polylepis.1